MILGATGRPIVEFGGQSAWRQYVKRDVVASLQWLDIGDNQGKSPCMALYPVSARMDGGAFVIPQDAAYEYAKSNGSPTNKLIGSAFKAAVQMGFYPDKSTVHRIMDVIVEAMPDLIRMPYAAPAHIETKKPIMGIELTAKAGGKTILEKLV